MRRALLLILTAAMLAVPVSADDPVLLGSWIFLCDGTECSLVGGGGGATTEAELEGDLTDVSDVYTDNDGPLISTSGSDNEILTDDGAGGITSEPNLTFDGADLTLGGTGHLVLPQVNDAATPTLAIGDNDTGFYEASDDLMVISVAGTARWQFTPVTAFRGVVSSSPAMLNETASATNPTLIPGYADDDTGLGTAALNQLSLIAGGAEVVNAGNDGTSQTATFQGSATQADPVVAVQNSALSTEFSISDDGSWFSDPTDTPPTCDAGAEGTSYADDSLNMLCYCNGTDWVQMDNFTTTC